MATALPDAYVYDHVRTPRGKGKKDGRLHQATPVWLLGTLLRALQRRLALDTALVDDVVLGCVTPVGEQGADIARTAVLDADWAQTVAGVTQSRFCASGLESVNLAAAKVASGFERLVVAGGVESMSRWPMGSDGGAWFMDPRINAKLGFVPQGIGADLVATLEGFTRADVDAFALESHRRAAAARAEGRFGRSLVPVHDIAGLKPLVEHLPPRDQRHDRGRDRRAHDLHRQVFLAPVGTGELERDAAVVGLLVQAWVGSTLCAGNRRARRALCARGCAGRRCLHCLGCLLRIDSGLARYVCSSSLTAA